MDEFANALNRLRGYFEDLKEYEGSRLEGKKDFYAASMIVFSIINESLLAAELLMSKKAMAAPSSYKEMMDVLAERKVIGEELAKKMKLIVGKRNLISHEYGEIKREDVADMIRKIGTVREFVSALVQKYQK